MRIFSQKKWTGSLILTLWAVAIMVSFSFAPSGIAHAQQTGNCSGSGCYTLLAPLPGISPNSSSIGSPIKSVSITSYLQYMFNLIIALAAVAAVFMITWGGFTYMTSEAIPGKQDGLKKVRNAVYGLLLVLCSWLILRTIDPRLIDIPPTFVPQLAINVTAGNTPADFFTQLQGQAQQYTPADFFTQLQGQAQQYQANSTTYTQALQASQTQTASLQSQYNQLQTQTDSMSPGDPSLPLLQAQMSNLQNQIQTQQSQSALLTDNAIFSQSLAAAGSDLVNNNTTSPAASLSTVQASIAAVNATYANNMASLTPSDQQQAATQYVFTDAELLDEQYYLSVLPTSSDATINADIANIQSTQAAADASLASSSPQRTQLDSSAQQAITQLKADQAATDLGNQNVYNEEP